MRAKTSLLFTLAFCFLFQLSDAQISLSFDGTNDQMNCGTDSAFDIGGTALTLEAWIYAESWNSNIYEGSIIIKEENTNNTGYMLRAGNGGRVGCAIGDGSKQWHEINTNSAYLSLNTWHHLASTYDGSKLRIYVDGTIVDSLSVSTSISVSTTTPLTIGYHPGYGRYWNGRIDEVRVWKKTLSAAEINANMNDEFCSRQNYQLRAYYKFNQGTANGNNSTQTTIYDYSKFQNNASLSGFALTGNSSNLVAGANLSTDSTYSYDTISRCGAWYDPVTKIYYNSSGTYTIPFQSHMGCDSFLLREVYINSNTTSSISAAVCDSFISPLGIVYKKSGTYYNVLDNAAGCDSVITINLQVGAEEAFIDTTVCEKYISPDGTEYTSSGSYSNTIMSYINCDSLINIDLTVNYNSSSFISDYICDSVLSPSGTQYYKSAGTYNETLISSVGCDSVVTMELTSAKTENTITPDVCESYLSPKGNIYEETGTYYETLVNHLNCDSLLTIDLNVRKSTESEVIVNACEPISSPSNRYMYTESGLYLDTIVNAAGCDSFVSTDLTITEINTNIKVEDYTLTSLHTGASYQWLDCEDDKSPIDGKTSISIQNQLRGIFAVEITDNGCVDTSDCYGVAGLSIEDVELNILNLYPNPSNGILNLESQITLNDVNVKVRNMYGQVVFEESYPSLKHEVLNLNLSAGNYSISLTSDKGSQVLNLVIL